MTVDENAPGDDVDRFRRQWARELPDVDTSPMSVFGRINRLARRLHPEISASFAEHGIDRGEFDVIGTLRRSGPPYRLTPTELYTSLMLTSGGLTSRLMKLEEAGLIVREQSNEDRRSFSARLTRKGMRLAEAAFRADMANELAMLAALPESERAALAELLRKLLAALERRKVD